MKGRFLQRDPLRYAAGPALYEYVQSGVLSFIDPSGLRPLPAGLQRIVADAQEQAKQNLKPEALDWKEARDALDEIKGENSSNAMFGAGLGAIMGVLAACGGGGPWGAFAAFMATMTWVRGDYKNDVKRAENAKKRAKERYDAARAKEIEKLDKEVDKYNKEHGTDYRIAVAHEGPTGDREGGVSYVGAESRSRSEIGPRRR